MTIYCVMSGEARTDLDHVMYASTTKEDAERFALKNDFLNYFGKPHIEKLDVAEGDVPDINVGKLDGDPIDIDKAVEHYERTLETLKCIDWEDKE